MGRSPCCPKIGLNKGPWTPEEDLLLAKHIEANGEGCWRSLPKSAGLLRCGKSCRLRWVNYLRPNVKRGNISDDEEDLIIMLHKLLGNRWSLIAARIPGRTDNEIKNYWNTHLSKKLESRGIDPKTHKPIPQDQIRAKKTKRRSSSKQAALAQNPEKVHETNSNKHMGNSEICDDFDTQSTGSSFSSAQAKESLSKSDSDCWVLDKMPENNTIARNKYSSASSCSLSSDSDSPVSSSISCVQTHQNHNFVPAGNFDCPDRPQIYSVDSPDHVEDIPDDSEVLILDYSDGSEVLILDDSDMLKIPEDTKMLTVDNADLNGLSDQIKSKSAADLDMEERAETDPSSSLDFLEDLYQKDDENYLELSSLLSATISIDQEGEISDQLWGLLDQTIPDQSDPWDKLDQENWVLSDLPILEDSGPFYPNAEDYSSVGEFLLC